MGWVILYTVIVANWFFLWPVVEVKIKHDAVRLVVDLGGCILFGFWILILAAIFFG